MSRTVLVLRPQPGNDATAIRLRSLGLSVHQIPLFHATPLAWTPPVGPYDAVLLTSANAPRLGGTHPLADLPVVAVGEATAAAARSAGYCVAIIGSGDVADAVAAAHSRGYRRLLHLAGREHIAHPGVDARIVYASEALDHAPGALRVAAGGVALLHSPRAARSFAALVDRDAVQRPAVMVAALSDAVATAAGAGWGRVAVAKRPDDATLALLASRLAIDHAAGVAVRGEQ